MVPLEETSPPINNNSQKDTSIEVTYLAEETPSDSRYAPLAVWLQERLPNEQVVSLTFQQIETIIGDALPTSAHTRGWWANDSTSRVQSQQWLEVGWRVSKINMREETIVFSRIKDRQKQYIDFFSEFLISLKNSVQFPIRQSSPDGFNWIIIARIPKGMSQTAFLGVSFARRKRFRIELYINTGDIQKNKDIFDKLLVRKSSIELEVDLALSWERLEGKDTARIACYRDASIEDEDNKLAELRKWAVETILRFQPVMEKFVSEVIHDL